MDYSNLPSSRLADLYIRLRDEVDRSDLSLDPNHKLRAPIAMAILCASETLGLDIVRIEEQVREMIGQTPPANHRKEITISNFHVRGRT
jgi:hypothetical protein